MKKLSTIIIAMALVLGLGQCKKQETPATTDPEDGLVYITVNVGDNGAKHEVYPNTGAYVFENNDVLYVGNNGHYIGTLTYNDGAFSGSITSPSTEDYLHFYFLGGLTPSAAPTAGSTTDFTVSIADQSSKLPILSYGQSTQKYTDANATYSTILRNKCGLVKFVPATPTPKTVTVGGMKTTATIDFATGGITSTGTTGGIKLYSESDAAKWAVLLQQDAVDDATVTISGFAASASVPTITNNYYNSSGVGITMTVASPTGAINGLFAVGDNGAGDTIKVYFSKGNLQYIGSAETPYWKFADNQWDYLGTTTGQNSTSVNVDRDLFCWGTSGYDHGAAYFQPWATYNGGTNYSAYGGSYNLYDQTGQADWGYNAIQNGGDQENSGWLTPRNEHWTYLFQTRTNAASKWGYGNVNGVNGMILLPDEWTLPGGLTFTSGSSSWANVNNSYDSTEWAQMEANGAVFLPAAGNRYETSVGGLETNGIYWSSSRNGSWQAYDLYFYDNTLSQPSHHTREHGLSVRLVCFAE